MPIRLATPDDASQMLVIYTPYVNEKAISFESEPPTETEFSDRIARGLTIGPWLVSERDNQVLGYAYATRFETRRPTTRLGRQQSTSDQITTVQASAGN